jgi:putative phosphoribosyl transferase
MDAPFPDRSAAGRQLAEKLSEYTGRADAIVLALPRGGVPVAYEVAQRLDLPLDVFVVRKLGLPGYEELAMGAIASGGVRVVNEQLMQHFSDPERVLDSVANLEALEIERREREYRDGRAAPELRGRTVILVDDGLATGATMRAAVMALRQPGVGSIIVAVPVGAPETCRELEQVADRTICAIAPENFEAVGQYYDDFAQTTDEEVRELLAAAAERRSARGGT